MRRVARYAWARLNRAAARRMRAVGRAGWFGFENSIALLELADAAERRAETILNRLGVRR